MLEEITREYVKGLLPRARRDAHKGTAGRVLIIAGSPGMAGAAVLASGAALRSGAGLVYVSADERIWPIIQTHEPCAVCVGRHIGVRDGDGPGTSSDTYGGIATLESYDAIAIGPGLSTSGEAALLVDFVARNYKGTLVIDADALNIIADGRATLNGAMPDCEATDGIATPGNKATDGTATPDHEATDTGATPDRETSKRNNIIITPHPGEAARLLGVSAGEIQSDRETAAAMLAEKYGAVAVLKGHRTLVATPEYGNIGMDVPASDSAKKSRAIFENTTGNPGMATAGSGDVLTGVIASFAARGMSAFESAAAGVYVHGLAGDIAAGQQGEYGLIATDIAGAIPAAIKQTAQ